MEREYRAGTGIVLMLASSAAFGTSGTFATALIQAGWSPLTVVLFRVVIAAVLLAVPTVLALRQRWHVLRQARSMVLVYGVAAIAGAQVCYFCALQRLPVGVALLLEYLGVVLVVGWMWLRQGQRPHRLTVGGSLLAVAGLAMVLELGGNFRIDPVGVLWGLGAAVGLASYFVLSAQVHHDLPPVALAGTGLAVGAVTLGGLSLSGLLPSAADFGSVTFSGWRVSWIVPMLGLSLIAAALSYLLGILGSRVLGATLASFVGLTEVLFAVLFAWLLLDQLPSALQLGGGSLVVAGVALVRIDELRRERASSRPSSPTDSRAQETQYGR